MHRTINRVGVCVTSSRRASRCDGRHPVPMMLYAGPRLRLGAQCAESIGQVTNLHQLKVLSEV